MSVLVDNVSVMGPTGSPLTSPTLFDLSNSDSDWLQTLLAGGSIEHEPDWQSRLGDFLRETHYGTAPSVATLSLFSGAGGLDIGFHDSGFQIREMVEIESAFSSTLTANSAEGGIFSGCQVQNVDIRDFKPVPGANYDFIIGGPPCQTFSAAGRRAAGVAGTTDRRGTLFEEYVRLLEALQPVGFLFENVYAILGARGGRDWEDIVNAFKASGYVLWWRILDAADYGVPQNRERVFIVGVREDLANKLGPFRFPRPTHGPDSYSGRPHESAGLAVTGASETAEELRVAGRYGGLLGEIPPGLNYSFFTEELGHPRPVFAWRSKFSDFLYKADPERPVRTVKAQGGAYTGPLSWENRHFSSKELKRLQTFPDSYFLEGSRSEVVHQIGNSVPPQMARILGMAVMDQLFGFPPPATLDYLEPNEQLSFRARKKQLTTFYRERALAHHKSATPRGAKSKGPIFRTNEVWITEDFQITEDKPAVQSEGFIFEMENSPEVTSFTLLPEGKVEDLDFELTLRPKKSWLLIENEIKVLAKGVSLRGVTVAFKLMELYIRKRFGYEDLVQLSGYFQAKQSVEFALHRAGPSRNPGDFFVFLSEIVSGNWTRTIWQSRDLADRARMDESRLFLEMQKLKGLGFEVRNHSTNPQLPESSFLVPYSFPTLTSRSVQLRKSLS